MQSNVLAGSAGQDSPGRRACQQPLTLQAARSIGACELALLLGRLCLAGAIACRPLDLCKLHLWHLCKLRLWHEAQLQALPSLDKTCMNKAVAGRH